MKYKVVSTHVQISGLGLNSWSLDATSNEELFFYARQEDSCKIDESVVDTDEYAFADAMLEGAKDRLRSFFLRTVSVLPEFNSYICQLGIVYIVETNDIGIENIVSYFVKRPLFSVEQLATDLYSDFVRNIYVALGDSRYDNYPYPNLLEKFVAAVDRWWMCHNHYSYLSRYEVINTCRILGVQNNLQMYPCF